MTYQTISVEKEPSGVCTLTLNRPQARNAFDYQMMLDLEAAMADIRKDDNVHSLIITGAGRAFCGGGELKWGILIEMTIRELLEYEALAQNLAMNTQDHREAVRSFVEKRPGKFVGR